MKSRILLSILFLLTGNLLLGQTYEQLGSDINGIGSDNLGSNVSITADGNIMAISSPGHVVNSNEFFTGQVKVFELVNNDWVQKGSSLTGEVANDSYGTGLSISDDGTVLVVGAPNSDAASGAGSVAGRAYVYEWSGSDWALLQTLDGVGGENFGSAISVSADGVFFAAGAPNANGGGSVRGAVRVYQRAANTWTQVGNDVTGVEDSESAGRSVSLKVTATDKVLAVGGPAYSSVSGNFDEAGVVRVYRESAGSWGTTWSGSETIIGALNSALGGSVDLSDDASRLAIGAPNGLLAGDPNYVEVYDFNDSSVPKWQLVGSRINSNLSGGNFGKSVGISGDGTHLVVGAPTTVEPGKENGYTKIFKFESTNWAELDSVPGVAADDEFGFSVAINSDGSQYSVGAPFNDAGGDAAGQVKVFGPIVPDKTGPVVTLSTSEAEFSNTFPLSVTIAFDEEVTGFTLEDIVVVNGTAANLASAGALTFSAEITPVNDGKVTVDINENAVNDLAGNANTAASTLTLKYDNTAPIISVITPAVLNPANSLFYGAIIDTFPKSVNIVFDGAGESKAAVFNPTDTSLLWILNTGLVPALAEGQHSMEITALDSADNQTVITFPFTVDSTPPAVLSVTAPDSVGNSTSFEASIIFSEVISNFAMEDITVSNGSVSALTTPDSTVFTATIVPGQDGDVTLQVPSGIAFDLANNINSASDELLISYDNTSPQLVFSSAPSFTNAAGFNLSMTVSEEIRQFGPVSALDKTNCEVTTVSVSTDGFTVTFLVTPINEGAVSLSYPAGVATDLYGNKNEASEIITVDFDGVSPVVTINQVTETTEGPITLTGTIVEANLDSLFVTVGTTEYPVPNENITADAWSFTSTFNNLEEGIYDIAARAVDAAGNDATATIADGLVYNTASPTVEIQGLSAEIGLATVPITFAFSEPVTDFGASDITVSSNATLRDFAIVDGRSATATITVEEGTEKGATISIRIDANTFEDLAGLPNENTTTVSTILNFKYSGGSGTASDPYLIANEADLRALSANTQDFASNFEQIANITMSDNFFRPIGVFDAYPGGFVLPFTGSFDGKDYFIKNLKLGNSFSPALFAYVKNSKIENIKVVDVKYNYESPDPGEIRSGSVSGLIFAADGNTTVKSCSATGRFEINNLISVGGLIGQAFGDGRIEIRESFSDIDFEYIEGVEVTTNSNSDFDFGGLVSFIAINVESVLIENSYSLSNMNFVLPVARTVNLGGLVANNRSKIDIVNSYFSGTVNYSESLDTSVGGLVGRSLVNTIVNFDNVFWDKQIAVTEYAIGSQAVNQSVTVTGTATEYSTFEIKWDAKFKDLGWDISKKADNNESTIWKYDLLGNPYLNWQDDNFEEFTVSGQVVDENGNPVSEATVELAKQDGGTKYSNSVKTNSQGNFSLQSPSVGFHSIIVKPNNAEYVTTYFGNTNKPLYSRQIHYDRTMTIRMVPKSQVNNLDGAGRVKGNVVTATGDTRMVAGRMLDGEPLVGVQVSLLRVSDNEILITVETDENGVYEITGIPAGEYQLLLNLPGVDVNLAGSTFSMDEEGTPLVISAAVSEDGVVFNIEEEILGIENEIEVAVYPNPVRDYINIQIPGKAVARIIDVNGTVLKEESFTDNLKLNISALHSNMYFLEISNSSGRAMRKLIKK